MSVTLGGSNTCLEVWSLTWAGYSSLYDIIKDEFQELCMGPKLVWCMLT